MNRCGSPAWQLQAFFAGASPPPLRSATSCRAGEPLLRFLGFGELGFQLGARLVVLRRESCATRSLTFVVCSSSERLQSLAFFGLLHDRCARGSLACLGFRLESSEVEAKSGTSRMAAPAMLKVTMRCSFFLCSSWL